MPPELALQRHEPTLCSRWSASSGGDRTPECLPGRPLAKAVSLRQGLQVHEPLALPNKAQC
jgi:hypothetical protein